VGAADHPESEMSKAVLMSVLFMPVLVGVLAGKRLGLRGLLQALAAVFAFDLLYFAFLYYQYFRWR
jgi:hypothetical protein